MAYAAYRRPRASDLAARATGDCVHFRCDTEADRPSANVQNGDSAYTLDSKKFWDRDGGAWVECGDASNTGGGGSGGIAWRSFTLLADIAGVTKTNIGTSFVELSTAGLRSKVDLTGFTSCRIVAGVNKVGTGTQSWKLEYSTDQSVWADLTGQVDDAGAAGERLNVGAFAAIPAGAKADVFIRCVGKSTVAGDDPVVKSVGLQVK